MKEYDTGGGQSFRRRGLFALPNSMFTNLLALGILYYCTVYFTNTFWLRRSRRWFWTVNSLPMSMAMLRRLPTILVTSSRFWSISPSRASPVTCRMYPPPIRAGNQSNLFMYVRIYSLLYCSGLRSFLIISRLFRYKYNFKYNLGLHSRSYLYLYSIRVRVRVVWSH